ncbi:MAG: DUF1501 domain-containing protein [Pseudomonadota bacterium]
MINTHLELSRRSFLKSSAAAFAGGATMRGGLANMTAMAADVSGYKALVCILFAGGLDCHDVVLPLDQPSYNAFADIRQELLTQYNGVPGGSTRTRGRLLPLNPENAADFGGRQFALPETLAPIHSMFENGEAAIIGNVGPLIEPTTRTTLREGLVAVPPRLYSHNDQISTWLASEPEGARFGWGGRIADFALQSGANVNPTLTAVSIAGNSVFLSGETAQQFQVSSRGASELDEVSSSRLFGSEALPAMMSEHFRNIGGGHTNVFQQDVIDVTERSIAANAQLAATLEDEAPFTTVFPEGRLAGQLAMVARLIAVHENFGVGRQVFYVSDGGYDTHSNQARDMTNLQLGFSGAVAAFQSAMAELGVANDVTLFTTSDFGRTLTANGDGTDHGWGGHHFVVGGAVNGRRIYGSIPEPAFDHELDSGRGRLIPSVSVEQFAGTLGNWFGLTNGEVAQAAPGITNFAQRNIGFV